MSDRDERHLPARLVFTLLAGLHLGALAAAAAPAPIAPWVLEHSRDGASCEVLVVLKARADLSPAARLASKAQRGAFVYEELLRVATASQAPLRDWLDRRGVEHRAFHVVNAIWLKADRSLLLALAQRPEVARIAGNPRIVNELGGAEPAPAPEPEPGPAAGPAPGPAPGENLLGIEWGVERIGAPALWDLGFDGQGLVVGGMDTGIRWTHRSLRDHYRGWDGATASHDYNWHDAVHDAAPDNPCGSDAAEPCDDSGHGTHTIAIAVGGDAGDDGIGVAPGARFIGCRNMNDSVGTPASYLECFEFHLAPYPIAGTPADGRPDLAPDVTVNSWTCPPSEGCDWDTLEAAVEAHRAAGIMTVVAAGNAGSGCGTVRSPPSTYGASYSIGASNSADFVAGFSSRGLARDTGLMKPDLVAPGAGIRSATAGADDAYASWSGTSMATPNVAGAVALLWSAAPGYRNDPDRTAELLNRTSVALRAHVQGCEGDYDFGPNATWGHGRLDLERAAAFADAPPVEMDCANGADEDGDGWIDCADPDCVADPGCPELGHCDDRLDNDTDGSVDCADTDCIADPACPELGNCRDGLDNDADGAADCADRDCDVDPACPGLALNRRTVLNRPGLAPPLAEQFAAACRYPAWRLCPELVSPGPLDGRLLAGEALPTGTDALWLYQHSEGLSDLRFGKAGADLAFGPP